jgi:hypothetical protein
VSPGAALFRMADLMENLLLDIPVFDKEQIARLGAGPDLLLYLLTALRYPKVGYVRDCLTFFRSHSKAITAENSDVITSYLKTYLWFAQEYCGRYACDTVLARYWLEAMRTRHAWVSFREFARGYGLLREVASLRAVATVVTRKAVNKICSI